MFRAVPIVAALVAAVAHQSPAIHVHLAGGTLPASCPDTNGQFEAARPDRDAAWIAAQRGSWPERDVESVIRTAWLRAEALLRPATGQICLQLSAEPRSPVLARMRGIAGSASGTGVISLFVAPSLARADWRSDLSWTVAHEFHHIAAARSGATGLDVIIREGLAHHFAWTLLPGNLHPSADALDDQQERAAWPVIRAHLDQPGGDFTTRFMFGGPAFGNEVPGWAGYTIGFRIVRSYAERRPALRPLDLIDRRAAEILAGSRFGSS